MAMVRPVLPVIEYYMNYDYISQELCENKDKVYLNCNGNCFLEKQLKKLNPIGQDQKPVALIVFNLKDYPISTLDFFTFKFKPIFYSSDLEHPFFWNIFKKSDFEVKIFRPPILTF